MCMRNNLNRFYSQSQMVFIFKLIDQYTLDNQMKIILLIAPPGSREVIYDESKIKKII